MKQEVRWNARLRFQATGTVTNQSITASNLLDSIFIGTGAATGYQLFAAAKIKFVEVWSVNVASSAPQTVSIQFNGASGTIGDRSNATDSSMSIEPAHVKLRPPKQSTAGFYFPTGASNLFQLTVPGSAIVDIGVMLVSDESYSTAIASAPAATTAGYLYSGGLDGLRTATTLLKPIGLYTQL